ncbi:hypothetical protein [Leptospira ilyithenensis]|uniref:hypothetical protein n=1 Tax=Leptospira ilyithenensis TaxID=2484901 RepID=UPI003CCC4A8E
MWHGLNLASPLGDSRQIRENNSNQFAIDFVYSNYGSYLRKANQTLEDPWLPTPLGNISSADAHLNFRDKGGVQPGLEHKLNEIWTYRLGYSYNTESTFLNVTLGATKKFE